CTVKEKVLNNLSDYFRQTASICSFSNQDSWVVLNEIEQRIRNKMDIVGTPLGEWGINIYRGILTGYNDAFIIDGKKKEELIAEDPKSAEIIRPYKHSCANCKECTLYPPAFLRSSNTDQDAVLSLDNHQYR